MPAVVLGAGGANIGNVGVLTLPSLPAGTNNIGNVGVLTLPAIPTGANTIGAVNVRPATAGGLLNHRNLNTGITGDLIKGSAGQVFGWYVYNNATAVRFLKIYNKATAPLSTDTPVMTIPIPREAGANVEFTNGIAFALGIGVRATVLVADADATAPAANDVVINILFK